MSAPARTWSPLPQAPVAMVPTGMSVEGAARNAWRPNVFAWVTAWRVLVLAQGVLAIGIGAAPGRTMATLTMALAGVALAGGAAVRMPRGRMLTAVLLLDVAVCLALLALSSTPESFSLMALYSYSTVLAWASGRPADAFVGAAATAAGYVAVATFGDIGHTSSASFVAALALYGFFALATSGFFTVVRRIGALEIATEISRERGRYRRDLHDRLGQALCGLHFELQAVRAGGVDEAVRARLDSLAAGYSDARAMLRDLFGGGDEPMVAANVASLIQQEARRMASQSGARIDVLVNGDATRIPPWMRPHVCAIAGECTTNALKNGRAQGIDVDLVVDDELVVLSVTDDGVGFDNPPGTITEKEGHYGLREMAERARLCGGEVVIASQPGFGTRVRLQVPLPDGGADDLIERDAGSLRAGIWSLFTVLRGGLALVALAELAADWVGGGGRALLAVIAAFVLLDVGGGIALGSRAARLVARSRALPAGLIVGYVALLGACIAGGVVPYFMLYAPLLLIAVALYGGRRRAWQMTALFAGGLLVVGAAGWWAGATVDDTQSTLVYVTNLLIVGLSAAQGAKVLDRLETLQIRVRYQALARLRHGLSNRMRDQLTERLDTLERVTRELAARRDIEDEEFAQVATQLEEGSSDLKRRLREIVHQLADPPPGRTPAHV